MPLAGAGRKPRLHRRHRVYRLVEDTKHRPKDNLELILTQSVEGKAGPGGHPLFLAVWEGAALTEEKGLTSAGGDVGLRLESANGDARDRRRVGAGGGRPVRGRRHFV